MSFTVGRASLPVDPSSATWNGDTLTIEGWISPTVANDTNQAYAIRQQLLGLVDNDDETVFPCTFSVDPDWDGFYTAESVRVEGRPGLMETQGRMPYTLVLRRVGGFTAPQFECIATTVTATNSHGLPTATSGIVAVPGTDLFEASTPTGFDGSVGASLITSRSNSDGLLAYALSTPSGTPFRFLWSTSPAYYYEGSARFEQSYGGTYYPLHGTQIQPVSSPWRISNGNVRVTLTDTAISVAHYDGSAWDTAKLWTLGTASSALTLVAVKYVRLVRNTPEEVIVRCGFHIEASSRGSLSTIDISLRRGCRWAAFAISSSYTSDWYINASPNEAGTALTGGFRATATDAAGNRYVVGGLAAQTNTLANGRLKLTTAAASFQFCIGSEVGADGSGQTVLNQYARTVIENHRVVTR